MKHGVQWLNLGQAARHDSSMVGFKKTCIYLSFSSETLNSLERQIYFTSALVPGIQNDRVVFPRLWTDSLLSCGTCRRAVKAQRSFEVPPMEEKTLNKERFVHKLPPLPHPPSNPPTCSSPTPHTHKPLACSL